MDPDTRELIPEWYFGRIIQPVSRSLPRIYERAGRVAGRNYKKSQVNKIHHSRKIPSHLFQPSRVEACQAIITLQSVCTYTPRYKGQCSGPVYGKISRDIGRGRPEFSYNGGSLYTFLCVGG